MTENVNDYGSHQNNMKYNPRISLLLKDYSLHEVKTEVEYLTSS